MILQTHAAVCGGVSEWRRIAAMVAGFGVTVCLHWFDDHLVHLVAATPSARLLEIPNSLWPVQARLAHKPSS